MPKKKSYEKSPLTGLKEQMLRDVLIDHIPAMVFWKNPDLIYLGCNTAFLQSLGLKSKNEVIGKSDYDLPVSKESSTAYRADDMTVIKSGKSKLNIEERQILLDGTERILSTSKVPLFDYDGNVYAVLAIYIDITERKKMEDDLRIAKEQAELASSAKSEFLRNMEHQLRTPFSGVYSLVRLMADEETAPEKKEMLEITSQSAKEFLDLLNDIIDVSRFQAKNTAVLAKKFDLRLLIEKAITMQRATAITKHLELDYEYPNDLPAVFISDPNRLRRVLLNLLSNAIRFTTKGSVRIRVKLAKQLDKKQVVMQLIVTDTGIGIPLEKQSLIYEKFYRVYPANQNQYVGAGLGLYIVKQIMEELEGEIELVSSPDKGTTFLCSLPLKRPLVDEILDADNEQPFA